MTAIHSPTPVSHTWLWQGFPIRYQAAGDLGPAVILLHGFGASSDHWRQNIPTLAHTCKVYAIDLLGFGQSAKPSPGESISYTFATWGSQIVQFCQEVVGESAFFVGNSIGCVVALQAAVMAPDLVRGVVMLNCTLRQLHERKRSTLAWYQQLLTPVMQKLLSFKPIGHFFFRQLAQPRVVRQILQQAYGRTEAVTEELVTLLLQPAQDAGAADVFLAFVGYSQGPLAEDLLPQLTCPVLILWGDQDPWEPIELGRRYAEFPMVEQFIPLAGVGHCPQDEAPELVNPILVEWIERHR